MNNLIVTGFICLISGYYFGYNITTLEFEKQIQESNLIIQEMQKANYRKELDYSYKVTELEKEVAQAKINFSDSLSAINKQSSDRLLQSENRAQYYRKQAESCSSQSRDFAEYTAKLDRQLTEGIDLVRELTELVKLRDEQLKQVGKQLKMDRELINGFERD